MRITLVALALMGLVGCAGADGGMAGQGLDSGAMAQAETGTGGTGGAAPVTGGSGGSAATGGSGGSGGGGTGGSSPAPDAGAPKMDALSSADTKPATLMTCDSANHMLYAYACTDPPETKNGKALYKDGRPCNTCVTTKANGTVEKQYVGCLAAAGALCVMSCSECK